VPAGGEDVIENEIVFGYNAIGNGSNTVTLGNTSIGELHCQVALTVDSDERIKRNISPSLIGLSFINALNPITFQPKNPYDYPDEIKPSNYKDRTIKEKDKEGKEKEKLIKADPRPPDNNKIYLGLTAQQVEEVMSIQGIDLELVSTSNRGKKAITYGNLIMPLITAVQELSQKVELLEARI
ncbi:tail fiber domain-containing protein, partial [Patescibacteria group bacterium]|nr:tail fiber domain-containing protein [Patescibacteria group bacterium]